MELLGKTVVEGVGAADIAEVEARRAAREASLVKDQGRLELELGLELELELELENVKPLRKGLLDDDDDDDDDDDVDDDAVRFFAFTTFLLGLIFDSAKISVGVPELELLSALEGAGIA